MKNRIELDDNSRTLLDITAGDLIPMLEKNKKLTHVKQSAFDYYSKKNKEHYQVHVTVTRCERDFLEFLQTEEMSDYVFPTKKS